jgi:hypothetical protein
VAVRVIALPGREGAPRVETGAIRFGNDWPGLFVRGDQAIHLAWCIGELEPLLRAVLAHHPELLPSNFAWDHLDLALSALSLIRKVINEEVRVP